MTVTLDHVHTWTSMHPLAGMGDLMSHLASCYRLRYFRIFPVKLFPWFHTLLNYIPSIRRYSSSSIVYIFNFILWKVEIEDDVTSIYSGARLKSKKDTRLASICEKMPSGFMG